MSPEIIYVVVGVVVLAAIWLFVRKSGAPQIEADAPPELEPARKPARQPTPAQTQADKPAHEPAEKPPASVEPTPPAEDAETTDEPVEAEISPAPPPAPISRRKKDVKGLRRGLTKVRGSDGLFGRLKNLFAGKKDIDPAIVDDIEEILLTSDVGVKTTQALLQDIREGLDNNELNDTDKVWEALQRRAKELVDLGGDGAIRNHGVPTVVLLVGVNGSGKTTTIGKLATKLVEEDKKVLLVAGDTFRAAAVAQLKAWGKRTKCPVFSGKDGADPASVVFDAIKHATDEAFDLVLVDTAGRLHTKSNLMDELGKVVKTCGKALDDAPHETLLVVDGTTGQNALQQAGEFGEVLDLTGIVLTKLDGTAKGGVVLAIAQEHGIPVRYIGVGERAQDLRDFDAEEFVEAMLGPPTDSNQAA